MRWLENAINTLTDMDWQWYPFVFLRPEKHERMTTAYTLNITLWYLPILVLISVGMLIVLPDIYVGSLVPPISTTLVILLYFMLFFFLSMRLIVAPAWNSRAKRLDQRKSKAQYEDAYPRLVDADARPLASDLADPTERTVSLVGNRTQE